MLGQKPVWVNIDVPTQRFTLHRECMHTNRMCETPYKGIGKLKRDGGWIRFRNIDVAVKRQEEDYNQFELVIHCK
ncbi:hypothetical protein [Tenuibacillus multivorans]|uniref:Uncharacterized protein n=1 Tax=Tenuibacillus multivorans TaxID=237069 RepID=A0A1H0ATE3_9BACI|nr:hypothetical protein [Tenuibacillus multivorans]GEL77833.1 hypothetical protein TMU01_20680 [Tenuibacillus multivorans]SDN36599.1 hypothetical protein SAMN05216498_2063 [Tenuibacillus multivorans]